MTQSKSKPSPSITDRMLGEASWLLSHAEALADYGRHEEAAVEWLRAAACEEQVACLLEAAGKEQEAAVHRVSAASCYQQIGQYSRAVTFLRAALSSELPEDYRARLTQQLTRSLNRAQKELSRVPAPLPSRQAQGVP